MKEIKLNDGHVAFVDDEDFEIVSKYNWRAYSHGRGFRVLRPNCWTRNGEWISKYAMLHRFILKCEKGKEIDHMDGNPLNNCRSNLRICSRAENCFNKPLRKDSKTGIIGVRFNKKWNTWTTRIVIDGDRKCIGSYDNKKEAALVYNVCASFCFGSFARLNQM